MIPFINPDVFYALIRQWLPSPLGIWHIMIVTGIVLGVTMAVQHARMMGRSGTSQAIATFIYLVVTLAFAHVFRVFTGNLDGVLGTPCAVAADCLLEGVQYACGSGGRCDDGDFWRALGTWRGVHGVAGMVVGILGLALAKQIGTISLGRLRIVGPRSVPTLRLLDSIAYGLVFYITVAKIGCSIIHDHMGPRSDFPLAVRFPRWYLERRMLLNAEEAASGVEYVSRLDLGLLEFFFALGLVVFFVATRRRATSPGFVWGTFAVSFGLFRVFSEWLLLLADDVSGHVMRVFGFSTPEQVVAALLLLSGIVTFMIEKPRLGPVRDQAADRADSPESGSPDESSA